MEFKKIVDLWNSEADEYNQWDTLDDEEKISFALENSYPIFDILPRLWGSGYKTVCLGNKWRLFDKNEECKLSGETFRDLCINIILAEI